MVLWRRASGVSAACRHHAWHHAGAPPLLFCLACREREYLAGSLRDTKLIVKKLGFMIGAA